MNYQIQQTESFAKWLANLRDQRAKTAIYRRIDHAEAGNFGDVKPVGEGVSEMRMDVGAGHCPRRLADSSLGGRRQIDATSRHSTRNQTD